MPKTSRRSLIKVARRMELVLDGEFRPERRLRLRDLFFRCRWGWAPGSSCMKQD